MLRPVNLPGRQRGLSLLEAVIATTVFALMVAGYLAMQQNHAQGVVVNRYGRWMSAYVNGVASYLASQGSTAPSTLTRTGTDWLKSTSCGGTTYNNNTALLSCDVPTDFNKPFGLGAPTVTFDFSGAPKATITFGVVRSHANQPDPLVAAELSDEINSQLQYAGYQYVTAFNALPNGSDVGSAKLRAVIDEQIQASVFLRTDGQTTMAAPIVSNSSTWALIARDSSGNENAAAKDPKSSLNVNDLYDRADGAWLSETQSLAKEAYELAARSPQFMTQVASGTLIPKPTCPAGMNAEIFTYPVTFIGGPNPSTTRLISGVWTNAQNYNGNYWRVFMYILYEQGGGWQSAPPSMGQVSVTTKCS